MKNGTLSYRVGELEKSVDGMEAKIDLIRTNELPHINQKIVAIDGKLVSLNNKFDTLNQRFVQATVVNVGAIILVAVLTKMFL